MDSCKLKPLKVDTHPIAYLLILCDQLQEWNRECYGEENLKNEYPTDIELTVNNSTMELTYRFSQRSLNNRDFSKITNKVYKLLTIHDIFEEGIQIN
jgi:hypothetical protein